MKNMRSWIWVMYQKRKVAKYLKVLTLNLPFKLKVCIFSFKIHQTIIFFNFYFSSAKNDDISGKSSPSREVAKILNDVEIYDTFFDAVTKRSVNEEKAKTNEAGNNFYM